MITEFWKGIAGGLATHWIAQGFTPAFVFWAGGLLAWSFHNGWGKFEQWWLGQAASPQVILLLAALIVIAASAVWVQRFEYAVLRLLEGDAVSELLKGPPQWRVGAHQGKLDEAKQKSKRCLLQKGLPGTHSLRAARAGAGRADSAQHSRRSPPGNANRAGQHYACGRATPLQSLRSGTVFVCPGCGFCYRSRPARISGKHGAG